MAKKPNKQDQQSVFQEAWENMSNDFSRLLPERLRQKQGKKKFLLLLAVFELLFLGVVGTLIYRWWSG